MHNGRKEIEHWIVDANDRYKSTMRSINFKKRKLGFAVITVMIVVPSPYTCSHKFLPVGTKVKH
jgi:hypothetical protein